MKLEIISLNTPTVSYKNVTGWGEDAKGINMAGEIAEITIKNENGESLVGFHIHPSGDLIITSYKSVYSTTLPANFILKNERPWNE